MKNTYFLMAACLMFLFSCKKEIAKIPVTPPAEVADNYVRYIIHKGSQYCDENNFKSITCTELKFNVRFDSSAIYSTISPGNQYDINKLYGFSDNNADHHQYSARFGWRWSKDSLRLFGYVYNEGVRRSKELGSIQIGSENFCSIKVENGIYRFTLNETTDTLTRKSQAEQAVGYRLYPYFGGDEMAPHDINIWIKELR